MSIQAKQKYSSSIVSSHKHLPTNRHVHTAVPVTGRETFEALKLYMQIYLEIISNLYPIMAVKGMGFNKWKTVIKYKKTHWKTNVANNLKKDKSINLYYTLKGNCSYKTAILNINMKSINTTKKVYFRFPNNGEQFTRVHTSTVLTKNHGGHGHNLGFETISDFAGPQNSARWPCHHQKQQRFWTHLWGRTSSPL